MPRGKQLNFIRNRLGSEGCSVLAVLVLAALWPDRFPGRWVTVDGFGQAGLYLGERRSRESLKAAIRRGAAKLRGEPIRALLESRRTLAEDPATGRPLREHDRRLAMPIPWVLSCWLFGHGPDLITPRFWRSFGEHACSPLTQPPSDLVQLVAELQRLDLLVLSALGRSGAGSAERLRLSRLQRLLRAAVTLGTQTNVHT